MSAYQDEFWNAVRRVAQEVVGRSQIKGTGVCTAYNPKTHAVKVMLQPHNIESGWIPVAALHAGNNFGILIGPRVGDPQKLDGQVFDIHWDGGDPDTMVAHHRQFSSLETPPEVQSGEILLMHEKGHKLFFAQDGSVTIFHAAKGGVMQFDASGNITHDAKGQTITVQTSDNADINLMNSGTGNVNVMAKKGTLTMTGQAIALMGPATLNGQPIQTGA